MPYPDRSWKGWGDPTQVPQLPESLLALLHQALGVTHANPAPSSPDALTLPPIRLSDEATAALALVVGPENATAESEARLRHTRGQSTPDLLRLRANDMRDAPDLVLMPASHDEVLKTLQLCSERRIAVVPYGGGTSVVGGLEPEAADYEGVVALDVRRLGAVTGLDSESRIATLQPGLRLPEAEQQLNAQGFTIGHFPQSYEYATIGGAAAARSSGQSSAGYGRFDANVLALTIATPAGTISLGRAPKSAAGPDLRELFLGSEGALGVITELAVAVRPTPETRLYEGWRFASFGQGISALRKLAQDGPLPTVLRLSDEAETALNLARPTEIGQGASGGCLAIVGYEGTAENVAHRKAGATRILEDAGAERADPSAGEHWAHDRFRGPYLRDALLDAGAIVETLETVTFWSKLEGLYSETSAALREALSEQGTPPVILCHVSHVYPAGASLYFTVGCAQLDDPVTQWRRAKAAASDAILAAGGSITHHHGVGIDHRDWYAREIGPLGVDLLRAVKSSLDPAAIMNPGVLIPGANRR
jgi:alkyldihydroxyacetonephosphate synthase